MVFLMPHIVLRLEQNSQVIPTSFVLISMLSYLQSNAPNYPSNLFFIFTNSLNNIYLLNNHIHNPSSQHNHPNKLLIASTVFHIQQSLHQTTTQHVIALTNILGYDEAYKLAKIVPKSPLSNTSRSTSLVIPHRISANIRSSMLGAQLFVVDTNHGVQLKEVGV